MQPAPIPTNEVQRLAALQQLGLLDTEPEERFDAITRAAVEQLKVPISTISLIDTEREWFKSCQGTTTREGKREVSFCGHALLSQRIFIVEDTTKDPRFALNPHVTGGQRIRFYAGVSLRDASSQFPIGVLCVKDTKPRHFTEDEANTLIDLGHWAELELNKHTMR